MTSLLMISLMMNVDDQTSHYCYSMMKTCPDRRCRRSGHFRSAYTQWWGSDEPHDEFSVLDLDSDSGVQAVPDSSDCSAVMGSAAVEVDGGGSVSSVSGSGCALMMKHSRRSCWSAVECHS